MNIWRRDRALGVDGRLLRFLDWWEAHGEFPILVLPDGGLRISKEEQARLYAVGASKARTLEETPHGRGGALDLAPYSDGLVPWTKWGLFAQIGQAAEWQGLEWGGRWTELKDGPHIQVPDWKTLPYPPLGESQLVK
jgi:hypothetical protein